jgi:hypothetical protein
MPPARYLIRFDDMCATMNWAVWDRIEPLLVAAGIAPVLAVVPDNRDAHLAVNPPLPHFWDRVREWAGRGWTVAVHGYQHAYRTKNPGIAGLTRQSEFAGVAAVEQAQHLEAACAIFQRQGLTPAVWIAPSHSFDAITVRLLSRLGFKVVHDGFFRYPYRAANGLIWVPQQLWHYRPAPPGIWTICYHCNAWTPNDLDAFAAMLDRHRDQMLSLDAAIAGAGPKAGLAWLSRFPWLASYWMRLELKLWSLRSWPESPLQPHPFKHGPVPY